MKVIHFGAGNIGRGFIGKLLADAGCEVLFADVNQAVVESLQARGSYDVRIVGEASRRETVRNVSAIRSTDPALIERIADCDLITTAVGPALLERIAPTIAAGICQRVAAGETRVLNVIACENMVRATSALKDFVFERVPSEFHAAVNERVGFADSAVDRIVPPSPGGEDDPLAVTVEEFSEWIVDRKQLKNWNASIAGMELTDNLMAFIERKLFTLNTGHAIAAYLGVLHGHDTICEAIANPAIIQAVRNAMEESGEVLIRRYGFDRAKHSAYIGKILLRFANPWLNDKAHRVAREPIRKLGRGDRLIRPLLGALEYGTSYLELAKGVAAVLCYVNEGDQQAIDMQRSVASFGIVTTLDRYSSGALPQAVCQLIETSWSALQSSVAQTCRGEIVV